MLFETEMRQGGRPGGRKGWNFHASNDSNGVRLTSKKQLTEIPTCTVACRSRNGLADATDLQTLPQHKLIVDGVASRYRQFSNRFRGDLAEVDHTSEGQIVYSEISVESSVSYCILLYRSCQSLQDFPGNLLRTGQRYTSFVSAVTTVT